MKHERKRETFKTSSSEEKRRKMEEGGRGRKNKHTGWLTNRRGSREKKGGNERSRVKWSKKTE